MHLKYLKISMLKKAIDYENKTYSLFLLILKQEREKESKVARGNKNTTQEISVSRNATFTCINAQNTAM